MWQNDPESHNHYAYGNELLTPNVAKWQTWITPSKVTAFPSNYNTACISTLPTQRYFRIPINHPITHFIVIQTKCGKMAKAIWHFCTFVWNFGFALGSWLTVISPEIERHHRKGKGQRYNFLAFWALYLVSLWSDRGLKLEEHVKVMVPLPTLQGSYGKRNWW